jgi:hypothetical protein
VSSLVRPREVPVPALPCSVIEPIWDQFAGASPKDLTNASLYGAAVPAGGTAGVFLGGGFSAGLWGAAGIAAVGAIIAALTLRSVAPASSDSAKKVGVAAN